MMKKRIQSTIALIAAIGLTATTQAADPAEPELIGVMFYADSCGSCKILDPKIKKVQANYLSKPLLFATFDHSNDASKNQAALLAGSLDLGEVYKAQEKASGFMLVIDAETKKVVTKLTKDMTEEQIKEALDQALSQA